jgi:transcriptional regulator with XRE-family HTH domain
VNIGEELRIRRQLKRLFQREVCGRVGISKVWLSLVENGHRNPRPELVERIKQAIDKLPTRGGAT